MSILYDDWFDETTSDRCPYECDETDNHSLVEHESFIKSWRKKLKRQHEQTNNT